MYNILVADDHPLFREAICNVIRSGFPGCTILETARYEWAQWPDEFTQRSTDHSGGDCLG